MSFFSHAGHKVMFGTNGVFTINESQATLVPVSLGSKLIVTGHSVPNNIIQWPWAGVITDAGFTPDIRSSTGPYSSAVARWENDYVSPDAVKALLSAPGAAYDLFLGTEAHGGGYVGWTNRSSVAAHIEFSDAYGYATLWHNLAASTGAKTFYSNFWRDDPTLAFDSVWRNDQNVEAPLWDGIIDYVNGNKAVGTSPMRLVPWLQVFMGVYDGIQSGSVTGITMPEIFTYVTGEGATAVDNVHAESNVGKWLQMATVLAVMYQRHPNEISNTWSLQYGGTNSISSTLAAQLRPIVWNACLSNSRTGLTS